MNQQEEKKEPGMLPIWYFVGWVIGLIGLVIMLAGFYHLAYPSKMDTELAYLHPNLWWGGFMLACGILFWYISRNQTVE